MADPVDAPELDDQCAALEAPPDLPPCDARRQQLHARHHPVLPPGDQRDYTWNRPALGTHMVL
jgi:hypothetical protein